MCIQYKILTYKIRFLFAFQLNTVIPDFNGVIQAGVNLIRQLDPLLQQIQTLIASLTTDINALINKVSSLTGGVIKNTLENAASSFLGIISHAFTLNLVGPALICANTAKDNAAALVLNGKKYCVFLYFNN